MFCIVAFIILSILGIISASNRVLAREALDCVLKRITFRPCTTGFDQKMKAKILGTVISRSEKTARFINRHFELLSWVFFFLLLLSSIVAINGTYLFYRYGSCNGLNQGGVCLYDPKGESNKISTIDASCDPSSENSSKLTLSGVNQALFPQKNNQSRDELFFIGCYECEFTRKVYPLIKEIVTKYNVRYTFAHFPTKGNTQYLSEISECVYQQDPEKYWEFNDTLFATDIENLEKKEYINKLINNLGIDLNGVQACVFDAKVKLKIKQQVLELEKTGLYGTPTIFINGNPLVGPKPYRVYAIMLKGLFYWLK